jgi:hypothetical protein
MGPTKAKNASVHAISSPAAAEKPRKPALAAGAAIKTRTTATSAKDLSTTPKPKKKTKPAAVTRGHGRNAEDATPGGSPGTNAKDANEPQAKSAGNAGGTPQKKNPEEMQM